MTEAIINVNNLIAKYDDNIIINNISFQINAGEIFMILGSSGSGKTTLLNHIVGLLQPVQGEIIIDGDNIAQASELKKNAILRKVGVMYQTGALFGSMSLLENVRLPLEEFTDLPVAAMDAIAANKLAMVGLSGFIDFMPAEISGGMRKRAAIARAMALDPKILFLDEPSAGLDPITSADLDQLVLNLAQTIDVTFVIVSHELPSVYTIAERVIVLHQGQIAATGTPKALRDKSKDAYVRQFFNRQPSDEVEIKE